MEPREDIDDMEAGVSPADSVRTLEYDSVDTPLWPAPRTPAPVVAAMPHADRPWMTTYADLDRFREIYRLWTIRCAFWKGWDRVATHPAPQRRCPSCRTKVPRCLACRPVYVLTEREYAAVEAIFQEATRELEAATEHVMQRHLGNFYRILTAADNQALLQRGLRVILFRRIQSVVEAVRVLFRNSVPESDVQTR